MPAPDVAPPNADVNALAESLKRLEAKVDSFIVYFNQFFVQWSNKEGQPMPSPTPRIDGVTPGGTGEQFVPNSYGYRD